MLQGKAPQHAPSFSLEGWDMSDLFHRIADMNDAGGEDLGAQTTAVL